MLEILLTAFATGIVAYLIRKMDELDMKLDRVQEEVLFLSLHVRKRSTDEAIGEK
jgi:hypothetical protein